MDRLTLFRRAAAKIEQLRAEERKTLRELEKSLLGSGIFGIGSPPQIAAELVRVDEAGNCHFRALAEKLNGYTFTEPPLASLFMVIAFEEDQQKTLALLRAGRLHQGGDEFEFEPSQFRFIEK